MSSQSMEFPNSFDEFVQSYGFKDKEQIYTNGIELIPVFRVRQWLEQKINDISLKFEEYGHEDKYKETIKVHGTSQIRYCRQNIKL